MIHEAGHIISAGEDFSVKIWSADFTLWGTMNQAHEVIDKTWYFPDAMFVEKRSQYLLDMSSVIKKVNKEELDTLGSNGSEEDPSQAQKYENSDIEEIE